MRLAWRLVLILAVTLAGYWFLARQVAVNARRYGEAPAAIETAFTHSLDAVCVVLFVVWVTVWTVWLVWVFRQRTR